MSETAERIEERLRAGDCFGPRSPEQIHPSHDLESIDDVGHCKVCLQAWIGEVMTPGLADPCTKVKPKFDPMTTIDVKDERLKKPARQHPVAVGESVRRTTEGSIAPFGTLGRVLVVWSDAYQVELRKGFSTMWAFDDCTPCDPPTASHDTPAGKETAQAAAEPKPGDVVRLV